MNFNDQLAQLLGRLQELAPTVWDAAMRQAIINARIDMVWAVISLLVAGGLLWLARHLRHAALEAQAEIAKRGSYAYADTDGYIVGEALSWTFAVGSLLLAIVFVVEYLRIVSNPTWAALQLILAQFGGK